MAAGRIARRRPLLPAVLLIAALAATFATPAAAWTLRDVRVQPTYLTGDFDTGVDSDIAYVPLIFALEGKRDRMRFTVPWLSIRTSEPITFVGGDVIRRGSGGITTASGLGDIVGEYEFDLAQGGRTEGGKGLPWIAVGARVKAPTADERRGLGSGELDYGPQLSLLQPFGPKWFLLGDVRYVVRGDPPGLEFRNTRWFSVGAQRKMDGTGWLSIVFDHRQSVLAGRDAIRDLTLAWDGRVSDTVTLRSAFYVGLSDTAQDWGMSVGLSFR